MANATHQLQTKLVHAGEPKPRIMGAVSMPIFQSANFEYGDEGDYHDIKYIRLNNTPNHEAVQQKLAAIENAESALVTASGMAAISTTLLAILSTGDHLLIQEDLYGGTHDFITKDLPAFGVAYDFIDINRPESWEGLLRAQTKAIYVEAMSNPLLRVPHLDEIAAFARVKGILALIDNTFTSPVNFRPCEHGFDVVLHSATKYLNGHSDIVAGAVIGGKGLVTKVKHRLDRLGGSLDPHAAFLLQRGMKTLGIRVRQQNESAQMIAKFLNVHPSVAAVYYPGIESSPHYQRARTLFDGFGGVLSLELKGGVHEADVFVKRLTLPLNAPSLGGVETLVTRPALTSHSGMSHGDRLRQGISDRLIRMSVGIEDTEDLINDIRQALSAA